MNNDLRSIVCITITSEIVNRYSLFLNHLYSLCSVAEQINLVTEAQSNIRV
jgi:hypothetical protein